MANMSVLFLARAASSSRDTAGQRVPAASRRPPGRLPLSELSRWGPACGTAAHAMAVQRRARSSPPRRAILVRLLAGCPACLLLIKCYKKSWHGLHHNKRRFKITLVRPAPCMKTQGFSALIEAPIGNWIIAN